VNFVAQSVYRTDGRDLRLSALEAKLLGYLADRPGAAVGRDEIMDAVWAYNPTSSSRTLDVTVFRLRTKIEQDPAHPKHIITVYGHGYRFVPHDGPAIAAPEPISGPKFVGRQTELGRLATLCKYGPVLATVTGPPGVGKSRIARELGRILGAAGYAIITCNLADADTMETLARAVAAGFGLAMRGQEVSQVSEAIAGALRSYPGRTVILLDEADRALGPIATLSKAWVAAGAAVVCTSRERISCRGEEVVDLGPLSAEDSASLYGQVAGQDIDADVEELVAHLDGLPLAIEIAAGHAGKVSAADIEALGSALEASWVLLSVDEQAALSRFTTFRGGFDLSAAEALLGPEDSWLSLDILDRLDRCSLVAVDRQRRFHLLESIRAFAASKATQSSIDESRDRHAAHYLSLVSPILQGRGRYPTSEIDVRNNIANLIEISTWIDRPRDAALALLALRHALLTIGADRELFQRVAHALEVLEIDDTLRARLHCTLAVVGHTWRTHQESKADLDRALELLDPDLEPTWTADCHVDCSHTASRERRPADAIAHAERAQALLGGQDRERLLWRALICHGDALGLQGDRDAALACVKRAQEMARSAFNGSEFAWSLWREGQARLRFGDADAGVDANRRCLQLARSLGDVRLERVVSGSLAISLQHQGDVHGALEIHQQSLELHRIAGCREDVAIGLGNMGNVYQELGEMELAMAHYERAIALHEELGDEVRHGVVIGSRGMAHHRMGDLDAADADYRECLARLQPANRVLQVSFIFCFRAILALDRGLEVDARAHIAAAEDGMKSFKNQDIEATHRLVVGRLEGDAREAIATAQAVKSPVVRLAVTLVSAGSVDP